MPCCARYKTSCTTERDHEWVCCSAVTENTRASYPIHYIANARIPCVGPHPKNLILLCCDAFGVLPPVSKLTKEQAMYHFISGYTAKVSPTPHTLCATITATTFLGCTAACHNAVSARASPFTDCHQPEFAVATDSRNNCLSAQLQSTTVSASGIHEQNQVGG